MIFKVQICRGFYFLEKLCENPCNLLHCIILRGFMCKTGWLQPKSAFKAQKRRFCSQPSCGREFLHASWRGWQTNLRFWAGNAEMEIMNIEYRTPNTECRSGGVEFWVSGGKQAEGRRPRTDDRRPAHYQFPSSSCDPRLTSAFLVCRISQATLPQPIPIAFVSPERHWTDEESHPFAPLRALRG